jgi:MFS family permease
VAFVGVGIGFYGQTVLLDGLSRAHGWSRASVSGAASLYFVSAALYGAVVGRIADRYGGRGLLAAGALVLASTLLAVSRVHEPWQLYVLFPVMSLGFAMCGNVPASAILARWFVTRRALAMSLSYSGVSLGGILLVPLGTWLIETRGLDVAVAFLAALVVGIALPAILFTLRERPTDHGLVPDGVPREDVDNPLLSLDWQRATWRSREAVRTRAFWLLALAFSGILFSQMSTLVHALALFRESMSASTAAFAVSGMAFGSTIGRLAVGFFADRLDKRRLAASLFAVQALALILFGSVQGTLPLYAAALFFGCTVGNIFMLQSLLVGELFGMASFGTVYGLLTLVTQVVSGLGPYVLGVLYESFGGYAMPLRILAGLAAGAALVLLRVRPPRRGGDWNPPARMCFDAAEPSEEERAMLEPGDGAPDFEVQDHEGNRVRLSELRGRKVLLWFYPKADTPG